jgi:molybdopterin-guanine dinucleotide biosynthesis protein A
VQYRGIAPTEDAGTRGQGPLKCKRPSESGHYDPRVSFRAPEPVGVVLAGGLGRRLGGSKATVKLGGQPLISYPLRALQEALGSAVVVAKADSELPTLPGVEVWMEPPEPRHPLTGVIHALGLTEGRPVVVCACDLPLVPAELFRQLAETDSGDAMVVAASYAGRLQPLLARYEPEALEPLAAALAAEGTSVREAVTALGVRALEVPEALLFNVNTPEDLLQAGALLAGGAQG